MRGSGPEFDQLFCSNYPLLLRIAFHITGDAAAAEDLCQEAFIRYLNRITPIPTAEQRTYWLIRVVKNLALNYEKRRGRERRAYNRLGHEPSRPNPSGESELLAKEARRIVRDAVRNLPFKLRSALVLREYGALSYREIAKSLGISESNVKVRVFRAREQLRSLLDQGEVNVS
jgi:RNA polymerase sigma-70 factor (ECF subfamily)